MQLKCKLGLLLEAPVKLLIEYLKERHVFNANWFSIAKLHQEEGFLPFFLKTIVISREVKEQNPFDKDWHKRKSNDGFT